MEFTNYYYNQLMHLRQLTIQYLFQINLHLLMLLFFVIGAIQFIVFIITFTEFILQLHLQK